MTPRIGHKAKPGNINRITPLETKVKDGVIYYRCTGPGHPKPAWLPENEFYFVTLKTKAGIPYTWRRKICKHCFHHYKKGIVTDGKRAGAWDFKIHGKIRVEKMQGYLKELELRCGSVRAAAEYAGVSRVAYLMWQGRLKNKSVAAMYRHNALKIIVAVRAKRQDS